MIIDIKYLLKCLKIAVKNGNISQEEMDEEIKEVRIRNNYIIAKTRGGKS